MLRYRGECAEGILGGREAQCVLLECTRKDVQARDRAAPASAVLQVREAPACFGVKPESQCEKRVEHGALRHQSVDSCPVRRCGLVAAPQA